MPVIAFSFNCYFAYGVDVVEKLVVFCFLNFLVVKGVRGGGAVGLIMIMLVVFFMAYDSMGEVLNVGLFPYTQIRESLCFFFIHNINLSQPSIFTYL